jgi:hypothetical protein
VLFLQQSNAQETVKSHFTNHVIHTTGLMLLHLWLVTVGGNYITIVRRIVNYVLDIPRQIPGP